MINALYLRKSERYSRLQEFIAYHLPFVMYPSGFLDRRSDAILTKTNPNHLDKQYLHLIENRHVICSLFHEKSLRCRSSHFYVVQIGISLEVLRLLTIFKSSHFLFTPSMHKPVNCVVSNNRSNVLFKKLVNWKTQRR